MNSIQMKKFWYAYGYSKMHIKVNYDIYVTLYSMNHQTA